MGEYNGGCCSSSMVLEVPERSAVTQNGSNGYGGIPLGETTHEREQQNFVGGGLRFRLVALITAAAMLVAGLGAGVALADEPEAAQQTQSETTQQESEGQQSTAETGDTADETNTNANDQTDPSQGADGAEGADAEPGDGGSEEFGQTQESDADKADDDQSAEKQSAAVPAPLDVELQAVEPRVASSIKAEQWTTNQRHQSDDITIRQGANGLGNITDERGMSVEDIYLTNPVNGYSFWKAVLLGQDYGINYGSKQTSEAGVNRTNSGKVVTRIRVSRANQVQLMIDGQWVTPRSTQNLQLVFYSLQDMSVGNVLTAHMSDWFNKTPDNSNGPKGYAVRVQVIDKDSQDVIATSDPMYYNDDHRGVSSILVTELDPEQYEIIDVTKGSNGTGGSRQSATRWETLSNSLELKSTVSKTYTYEEMISTGLSTTWPGSKDEQPGYGDDGYHVVFKVYVRRTTSLNICKVLSNDESREYANSDFTFSVDLKLPEGSSLRQQYPVSGGEYQQGDMVLAVDSTIVGVTVKPGADNCVTVGGLPQGTKATVTETGVPVTDVSVFSTSYSPENGTVTTTKNGVQTVTVTNTVSQERGKLTVTKTFTGLDQLTAQQRYDLQDSFRIESAGGEVTLPALTLSNASSHSGDVQSEDSDTATYTWTMNRLAYGQVVMSEHNYAPNDQFVATSVDVTNNGVTISDTAETTIDNTTRTVAFNNDYDATPTNVTVSKTWGEDVTQDERKPVTALITGTGTATDSDGSNRTFTQEVMLDSSKNWTATVENLPSQSTFFGTVSYSVSEEKVGDVTPGEAGFAAYITRDGNNFTITNVRSTLTYGTNDHLGLHKVLESNDSDVTLEPGQFKFDLSLVSVVDANDDKVTDTTQQEAMITLPTIKTVENGDLDGDGQTEGYAGAFDFGAIVFKQPGTYVLKVTESQEAEAPSQGGRYSFDDHALYARYTIGQSSKTGALEIQKREVAKTDEMDPDLEHLVWQDATGENVDEDEGFVDEYLTWHNTYVAPVSSLPLTGGRSTARTLLLTGGGVLLVAGAAWLLARRRRG